MTQYLYVPYDGGSSFYSPILHQDPSTVNKYRIISISEDYLAEMLDTSPTVWEPCNYYPDEVELQKAIDDATGDEPSVDKTIND
jgi:hypothetical protein